jgi:small GTP-binding protein
VRPTSGHVEDLPTPKWRSSSVHSRKVRAQRIVKEWVNRLRPETEQGTVPASASGGITGLSVTSGPPRILEPSTFIFTFSSFSRRQETSSLPGIARELSSSSSLCSKREIQFLVLEMSDGDEVVVIKLLVVGEAGVGKSCLVSRFVDDTFSSHFTVMMKMDFKIKTIELNGKTVKLCVWDNWRPQNLNDEKLSSHLSGTHGIVFVYDVTDEKALTTIRPLIEQIDQDASPNTKRILIGNKVDLQHLRMIDAERGKALAQDFQMALFECSAKSSVNVTEAFTEITRQAVVGSAESSHPVVDVSVSSLQSSSTCC